MREIESSSANHSPEHWCNGGRQVSTRIVLEAPPARAIEVTEIPSRAHKHHAGMYVPQRESGKDTLKTLERAVTSGFVI